MSVCTRDTQYGGRKDAMRLHYKAREGEIIQYVDVMSLYPYICKYFKFPVGNPVIQVGDACKDKEAYLRMNGIIKCSIVPPSSDTKGLTLTFNKYFLLFLRHSLIYSPYFTR